MKFYLYPKVRKTPNRNPKFLINPTFISTGKHIPKKNPIFTPKITKQNNESNKSKRQQQRTEQVHE